MAVSQEALLAASVLRRKRSGRGVYETFYGRITLTDRDYSFRVVHLIGRKFPGANLPEEVAQIPQPAGLAEAAVWLGVPAVSGHRPGHDRRGAFRHADAAAVGYDAVAVTGADMKAEHADRLRELKRPLVIVPDNDQAGLEASQRWQGQLLAGDRVRVLRLPDRVGRHADR